VLLPVEQIAAFINMKNNLSSVTDAKDIATSEFERTYLSINTPNLKHVESGDEDILITLETSDVTVTSINPQPISELGMNDMVYAFKLSAKLTIKDALRNVVFERILSDPNVEQQMTKAEIFLSPSFRAKAEMYKDNPEKLKKAVDKVMEHKGHFVLIGLLKKSRYELASEYETQKQQIAVGLFSVKGKEYEELENASEGILELDGKFHSLSKKNRIPKEQLISAWQNSIPVWKKVYEEKLSVLEEKASQGLLLNSAVALILSGDYDGAQVHLAKVPETMQAAKSARDMEQKIVARGTMLAFSEYAKNTQELLVMFRDSKGRVTIIP
jgi:hypothetical protein